jgi:hypothetical protein
MATTNNPYSVEWTLKDKRLYKAIMRRRDAVLDKYMLSHLSLPITMVESFEPRRYEAIRYAADQRTSVGKIPKLDAEGNPIYREGEKIFIDPRRTFTPAQVSDINQGSSEAASGLELKKRFPRVIDLIDEDDEAREQWDRNNAVGFNYEPVTDKELQKVIETRNSKRDKATASHRKADINAQFEQVKNGTGSLTTLWESSLKFLTMHLQIAMSGPWYDELWIRSPKSVEDYAKEGLDSIFLEDTGNKRKKNHTPMHCRVGKDEIRDYYAFLRHSVAKKLKGTIHRDFAVVTREEEKRGETVETIQKKQRKVRLANLVAYNDDIDAVPDDEKEQDPTKGRRKNPALTHTYRVQANSNAPGDWDLGHLTMHKGFTFRLGRTLAMSRVPKWVKGFEAAIMELVADGFNYATIGDLIGISDNAVKMRVRKIRDRIAKWEVEQLVQTYEEPEEKLAA